MDEDLPARKKKKNLRPVILIAMFIGIGCAAIFGIAYVAVYESQKEERLAKQAKEQYDKGDYNEAQKSYEKLTTEYSGSDKINDYQFFRDLVEMRAVVQAVTTRKDYGAALERLRKFIDAHKDDPLAKPTSGYGRDILSAGKKLCEDIALFTKDRVEAYGGDESKSEELKRADKAITEGRELIPVIDPFRGPDDLPLDNQRKAFDEAEQLVKHQRDRTAALNAAKAKLADPTDKVIQGVEDDLKAAGFLDDPEAKKIIAVAKGQLRDLVRYEDDHAAPAPPPPGAASSVLFVTAIGETKVRELAPGETPTIFLCVARGVLYAFEDYSGKLLWAMRVGPDVVDPPAVARGVQLDTGLTDVAVVTSNVGNTPAVSGHTLSSGKMQWYQPLPAPAAGSAIVMGSRAFVPVRDAVGSVFEFDLKTGNRVGRIRLGQPVADRSATIRPGTSLMYIAAEARRLYVVDLSVKDVNGNPVNPHCVQAIATGHLPGTVRVAPLFIGPEGTNDAERWMILAQANGPQETLMRAFAVEALPKPPAEGEKLPETPAAAMVTLPIPGWVSYPPVSDGEQIAVITDTGHFRLIGVKQAGNADKVLFPLPSPDQPIDRPVPGLVIPLEESTYWLLAGGQLQKSRLALLPNKGQEIVREGTPQPIGEPVHRALVNARKDTACVVVRSMNSSGCRAVAFGLKDGEIRWQRQLGLMPAKASADQFAAPVPQVNDRFVVVDEDGCIVAVPAGLSAVQTTSLPGWRVDSAPQNATGPTIVVASASGRTMFAITPVNNKGAKFVIRRVANGRIASTDEMNAPGALAGQPAIIGDQLLIPTTDGFVHRFTPSDADHSPTFTAGPSWLAEKRATNTCSITPLSPTTFATSDGGKKLNKWEWPAAAGSQFNPAGEWELAQSAAGPGVVLPPVEGGSPRFIVADTSGSVWMFAADKSGQHLRRWRHDNKNVIPAGKPSSGFAVQGTDPKQMVVTYVVEGKSAVAINPERDEPLWATRSVEETSSIVGAPQPAGENRWVMTDLAGRVFVIDGANGEVLASQMVGSSGAVPVAASGVVAGKTLTPLSDGTAGMIELPKVEAPKE